MSHEAGGLRGADQPVGRAPPRTTDRQQRKRDFVVRVQAVTHRVDGVRHYEVIEAECVGCDLCAVCPVEECITLVPPVPSPTPLFQLPGAKLARVVIRAVGRQIERPDLVGVPPLQPASTPLGPWREPSLHALAQEPPPRQRQRHGRRRQRRPRGRLLRVAPVRLPRRLDHRPQERGVRAAAAAPAVGAQPDDDEAQARDD